MARYSNQRKQSLMFCFVCIMLFIFGVTAGISYAYFIDHKEVTNTLNFGKLIISTKGETTTTVTLTPNKENGMTENGVYKIAVNDTVSIAGSIGLEENSVSAYIRMKVEMVDQNSNKIIGAFKTGFMAQMAEMVDPTNSKQWFIVGNYLYLGNEINSGSPFVFSGSNKNTSEATAVNNKIKMTDEMLTNEIAGNQITITFTLQAIQSAGMKDASGNEMGTLSNYTQANATKIAGIPVWDEIFFNALDENELGVYEAPTHTTNAMDSRGTFTRGAKDANGKYTHIELGTYPQTKYSGDANSLEPTSEKYNIIENKSAKLDNYVGTPAEYTIYKHKTTGDKYIRMDKVNPYSSSYKYSGSTTTISGSTDVYFKLEPIVWKILGVTNADGTVTAGGYDGKTEGVKLLLSSVKILTAMEFAPSSTSYTDKTNTIKQYLNGTFFTNAFTSEEQGKIAGTGLTTGTNTSETETNDATIWKSGDNKVFLLSASDLINTNYFADSAARQKWPTDYAGANYVRMISLEGYGGTWWSRSAYTSNTDVWIVNMSSGLNWEYPYTACDGVVPALFLSI